VCRWRSCPAPIERLRARPVALRDPLPAPLLGDARRCVRPPLSRARLALEAEEARETGGRQLAGGDRSPDRTAGLAAVGAVAKAAAPGDLGDVGERRLEALAVGEAELAQAGRVEDEPVSEPQQLPARRRVAAAGIVLRMAAVAMSSRPASALTSVDLPTPDEPMNAAVRPCPSRPLIACSPAPVIAETGMTAMPGATERAAST
jgi:hypothetical protein